MMELRISDMMDNFQDDTVQLHTQCDVSTDRIRKATMRKLYADTASREHTKKIFSKRSFIAVAAAVILIAILVPTTLAYGEEIWVFMFGPSKATVVESINHAGSINGIDGLGENRGGVGFEIINRSGNTTGVIDDLGNNEIIDDGFFVDDGVTRFTINNSTLFDNFEDAQTAAPFEISAPKYLPINASLGGILVTRFPDGAYAYEAHISYNLDLGSDGWSNVLLGEYYVGSDAYINLATEYTVIKMTVGEAEAAFVHESATGNQWLYWIKYDVLFVISGNSAVIDSDDLHRIAESL